MHPLKVWRGLSGASDTRPAFRCRHQMAFQRERAIDKRGPERLSPGATLDIRFSESGLVVQAFVAAIAVFPGDRLDPATQLPGPGAPESPSYDFLHNPSVSRIHESRAWS